MKTQRTIMRSSAIHGSGLFATCRIRRGTTVIEYTGTVRPWLECDCSPDGYTYLMSVDDTNVIDPRVGGNHSQFINHSCDPNCQAVHDDGRVFIVAEKTIQEGEEITIEYGLMLPYPVEPADIATYACHCGSSQCRGTMLGEPVDMLLASAD